MRLSIHHYTAKRDITKPYVSFGISAARIILVKRALCFYKKAFYLGFAHGTVQGTFRNNNKIALA